MRYSELRDFLFILLGWWWNISLTNPIHHIIIFIYSYLNGIKFLKRNLYPCKDKLLSSAFDFSLCFQGSENMFHLFLLLADNLIHCILEDFFCIYILAWVYCIVTLFTALLLSLPTTFGKNRRKAETRYIKPQSLGCLIFYHFLLSYWFPVVSLVISTSK